MGKINYFLFFILIVFGFSGCATMTTAPDNEKQQLRSRIGYLEQELNKQKDENAFLKKKLDEMGRKEVRMPTGTEIQTALKKAGFYKGDIDGQIGPKTKEAIQKFQEANKINADGVMGSRTWLLLSKYLQ
jgi:peptidoglycan hydrolase-like protein with peptidoglycan-binding domain